MKNILIIAYYFPPKGGAGVQRTTKFANYLSKFGYNVYVLTVKEDSHGLKDASLNKEIYSEVKVYRSEIEETKLIDKVLKIIQGNRNSSSGSKEEVKDLPSNRNSLKKKIKGLIFNLGKKVFIDLYNLAYVPDDKIGWLKYAVEEGNKIIKENNIHIIYTTSAPYTSHLIGHNLAKKNNVKWIADFRDPWACNPFVNYGAIIERKHKKLESMVVNRAEKVLSVSQPIIDDFKRIYKHLNPNKFKVITNGYDEEDFCDLPLDIANNNDKYTVLYNGTLYGKRSPDKILEAIDNLIKANKIPENKIQIKFLGEVGHEFKEIIQFYSNKYPEVVIQKDYVPHKESLMEMCKANALLLIIDEGLGSEGIFTGKIFEYLRSGKIILGIVPKGVAKDLILETRTGLIASPANEKEIENIIYEAYSLFLDGNKEFNPQWDLINNYSRENLTKALAEVIKEID